MYITAAVLEAIVEEPESSRFDRSEQLRIIRTICLNLDEELRRVGVTDLEELTFFLALIIVDSQRFTKIQDDPHHPAAGPFCPRGLLKISGEASYRQFGKLIGTNLEEDPQCAANANVAVQLAAEIWHLNYDGRIRADDLETIGQEFASRDRHFSAIDFDRYRKRAVQVLTPADPSGLSKSPDTSQRDNPKGAIFTVWYGTTRRPTRTSSGYSSERDNVTHLGRCSVWIPKSHRIGSIGSSLVKRLFWRRDDVIELMETKELASNEYWEGLQNVFRSTDEPKAAIVLVHGYNVTFESAIIRAAQLGYDLGAQRAMAVFSWPSIGKLGGYLADAATIEASEGSIADFLIGFLERSGAEKVHIIAHSMGNRGVLRAINRIAARAQTKTRASFGQIILAAADVDADLFRQLSRAYVDLSERTSMYVSSRDKAIEASHWLHEFSRAGLTPPTLIVDGIDTISVSNIDMSLLGHGYFAEARNVLADLYDLLVHGASPAMRFGLRETMTDDGKLFWQVRA
ncbi:alpha/beta hydrolase [Frankia sp. RB7]|nr:alpha/beta hydrolase [Frankia sp. RB7]